jgi:cyclase
MNPRNAEHRRHSPRRVVAIIAVMLGAILVAATTTPAALAQDNADNGIEVVQIRPNFYVIAGAGGNVVMQTGPDGIVLVDSGAEGMSEQILAAIREITPLKIRYIINTSMDADHVGGNAELARAGLTMLAGALAAGAGLGDDLMTNSGAASVLAHENVLLRMSIPTGRRNEIRSELLPTKTFAFNAYSMYLNGEGIQVIHQPNAHTDGDSIVFFRRGDVIATGDIIDTTRFPVIDVERGGTVQGLIDALNRLMEMSIHNLPLMWRSDRTLLVPGHGRVYDKLDLLEYRDTITVIRDRIQNLIDKGQTLEQVIAANPTLGYRSQYGTDEGEWTTDMFVEAIYNELAANGEARP